MTELLRQFQDQFAVETREPGFTDITPEVARWLTSIGASCGLVTVFIQHTSASLTIQENADPAVQSDLSDALDEIAPRGRRYRHDSEGDDDMPSHIKAMVTSTTLQVPVESGCMRLGTWQALYLIEHRDLPRRRNIVLHYSGTCAQLN